MAVAASSDQVQQLIDVLTQIEHGRQGLVDALWARLPVYVQEWAWQPQGGTEVDVAPQTRNLERITYVLTIAPAAGTLSLGSMHIPVPAGVFQMTGCSILLQPSDARRLVCATSGVLALVLTGEQVPVYGKVR